MPRPWRRLSARPTPSPATDAPSSSPLDVGLATATGRRSENQDRARAGEDWAVVSDGVGGQPGGARASSLAVEAATAVLDGGVDAGPVRDAVQAAHAAVRAGQVADPALSDMATTVTVARAVVVTADRSRWVVGHVGDSPAWRVSDDGAVQLTNDHTVAGELLVAGAIDAEVAASHPGRRFVTRVAGAPQGVDPDVCEVELAPGASLVIATDGISDVLTGAAIVATISPARSAQDAAEALIAAAAEAGTHDNSTVVVISHRPAPDV